MLERADQEVTSKGITSFQDAGSSYDVIERMKRMVDEGAIRVRLWIMARANDNATLAPGLDRARMVGYGDNRLTVRAIKAYMDGALGSRGAWLLEPYSDQPGSVGLPRLARCAQGDGAAGAGARIPNVHPCDRRSRKSRGA